MTSNGTARCASLSLVCDEILPIEMQLANPVDANYTICVAVKNKQLTKLLHFYRGMRPKYDNNGKLETGDDIGTWCTYLIYPIIIALC